MLLVHLIETPPEISTSTTSGPTCWYWPGSAIVLLVIEDSAASVRERKRAFSHWSRDLHATLHGTHRVSVGVGVRLDLPLFR
eukprot:3744213-Rhodomonas_salina.1